MWGIKIDIGIDRTVAAWEACGGFESTFDSMLQGRMAAAAMCGGFDFKVHGNVEFCPRETCSGRSERRRGESKCAVTPPGCRVMGSGEPSKETRRCVRRDRFLRRLEGEGEVSRFECEVGSGDKGVDDTLGRSERGVTCGCEACEAMWKREQMAAGTVMAKYE
ncbi:hypothetical protein B0H13DRAFT_1890563 [Mycena leptocephala]|nr:hypothetical protein B0H13DRAFT_1890563 [Mycena leptocephala]